MSCFVVRPPGRKYPLSQSVGCLDATVRCRYLRVVASLLKVTAQQLPTGSVNALNCEVSYASHSFFPLLPLSFHCYTRSWFCKSAHARLPSATETRYRQKQKMILATISTNLTSPPPFRSNLFREYARHLIFNRLQKKIRKSKTEYKQS